MASEKLGYMEILADLEAKRTAIEAAITAIRTALTIGALGMSTDVDLSGGFASGGSGGNAVELPTGALLGKSLPAAVKLYLTAVKKKQTTKAITAALKEGGVESTSDNFENVVMGALNRLKAAGDVLRFKDGWGLAEFYPENLRNRLAQGETKPKGKKSATKPAKSAKPRKGARGQKQEGPNLDARIQAFMNVNGHLYDPKGIAKGVGENNLKAVHLAIARLTRYGKVERHVSGLYMVAPAPVEHLKAV